MNSALISSLRLQSFTRDYPTARILAIRWNGVAKCLNTHVSDIRHFFTMHFYGLYLASSSSRTCSHLYAPLLYVSPVTMPIYLAPSLPLSCEISYNSFMQISHGREGSVELCPVKPERRNLEFYDPPTSPSFFRANISKRAAYRNPKFYVS